MSKFLEIFKQQFYPYLGQRKETFRIIFEYLDNLKQDKYLIVETGTTRIKENWDDGNSTIMFDKYCQLNNGIIYTVDIDPQACETSRKNTGNNTIVYLGDSVKFLQTLGNPENIDLLYLDSFDVDWDNTHPSSFHHIKELCTVYAKLKSGCLIVVDDNSNGKGKGTYVFEFLNNVGDKLLFDEYQIGYIKK
jgi:hypothetical protein